MNKRPDRRTRQMDREQQQRSGWKSIAFAIIVIAAISAGVLILVGAV